MIGVIIRAVGLAAHVVREKPKGPIGVTTGTIGVITRKEKLADVAVNRNCATMAGQVGNVFWQYIMPRRSHHVDLRGNATDRLRRRIWMVCNPRFRGTGKTVQCWHCGKRIRRFEVDRWPRCGHEGGRYVRSNVVPACRKCNRGRCNRGCHARL
jgi:hypothetical protein